MANYVKVFDGAGKDASEENVVAAEWETEYKAIQTAIATKVDAVLSGTTGELISTDVNGDLADADVDPTTNLAGITSTDIQADIDLKTTLVAVASSTFTRNGNLHLYNGKVVGNNQETWSATEDSWISFGPTGSGADVEQDSFEDYFITGAGIIGARLALFGTTDGTNDGEINVYAVSGDIASPSIGTGNKVAQMGWNADDTSTQVNFDTVVWLPVDADMIVKIYVDITNLNAAGVQMNPWFSLVEG